MIGSVVLYHVCMRNDAALIKKVKQPVLHKAHAVRGWISNKISVCRLISRRLFRPVASYGAATGRSRNFESGRKTTNISPDVIYRKYT